MRFWLLLLGVGAVLGALWMAHRRFDRPLVPEPAATRFDAGGAWRLLLERGPEAMPEARTALLEAESSEMAEAIAALLPDEAFAWWREGFEAAQALPPDIADAEHVILAPRGAVVDGTPSVRVRCSGAAASLTCRNDAGRLVEIPIDGTALPTWPKEGEGASPAEGSWTATLHRDGQPLAESTFHVLPPEKVAELRRAVTLLNNGVLDDDVRSFAMAIVALDHGMEGEASARLRELRERHRGPRVGLDLLLATLEIRQGRPATARAFLRR